MEDALFQGLTVGLFFGLLIYGHKYINKNIHLSRAKKGNINSKFYLAKYSIEKKKYESAIQYLNEVLSQNPNLYEPSELLALCYYKTEKFNAAIPLFERLLEENPSNAQYLFFLENCFNKTNNQAKASEYKERAIKLDRKNKNVKFNPFVTANFRINKLYFGLFLLAILFAVAYIYSVNKKKSSSQIHIGTINSISEEEIKRITDSLRFEQAKDLKGLGDLHIDSTTLDVIGKIESDPRYSQKTEKPKKNTLFNDFFQPYNPPNVSQKISRFKCPKIKLYFVRQMYVGSEIVTDLDLYFYNDTLIKIVCSRSNFLDSAFVYKYGEGIKVEINDTLKNQSGTHSKLIYKGIKWENKKVRAISFDNKMGGDGSTRLCSSLEIISKSNRWHHFEECEKDAIILEKKEIEKKKIEDYEQI